MFRVFFGNNEDPDSGVTQSTHDSADEAIDNCPPGRGVQNTETKEIVDPDTARDSEPSWRPWPF